MAKYILHREKNVKTQVLRFLGVLFCGLILLGFSGSRLEAQPAPLGEGKWKSVDQFVPAAPEEDEAEEEVAAPETPQPKATQALPKVETPTMATSSDPEILIDTTADTQSQGIVKKAVQTEKPGTTSTKASTEKTAADEGTKKPSAPLNPYNVRLAGLPSVYVKPIPATPAVRPKKKIVKAPDNQPKPTKEACEALSSMQKRELAAIEKDRQTLTALQAAIKDLGLSNKLNFAPGKGSLLGSSQPGQSHPVPQGGESPAPNKK